MDTGIIISLVSIFVLLLLSAFFSGSETALTAVSKAKMHSLEKEGNKRAKIVNKLREEKDKLIGALLLGNNLVNILASALATSALINLFGEAGVFYATGAMTVLVLIFAEVLPKSYAITYSEKMAIAIAPIIKWVVFILAPITQTVIAIVRYFLKIFGVDISTVEEDNKEELIGVIDLHQGDEQEIKEERAMLRSILDLVNVEVDEIFTHRSKVEMIDIGKTNMEIVEQVLNSRFTRLPLYQESQENIVGVIHVKLLLRALHEVNGKVEKLDISSIANNPWFIPDSTNLFDQLQEFRARREHFALVVDEYGSFEGIITLEDILEEIVGEIDDEYDISVEGVRPQGNGTFLVDGTVTLRDLNREFEWNLSDEHYSTIAGLVIYEAKLVPEAGQSFVFYDIRFDVLKRKDNQLTQLRLTPMNGKKFK
tara:strand:+ start:491 stop:1765 length:1275 start_codon:yes stop_codon:yes gene_type:complete